MGLNGRMQEFIIIIEVAHARDSDVLNHVEQTRGKLESSSDPFAWPKV